eukprot:scaffold7066_cov253-Pinguiococcus_pyrenoidosus.AAC.13
MPELGVQPILGAEVRVVVQGQAPNPHFEGGALCGSRGSDPEAAHDGSHGFGLQSSFDHFPGAAHRRGQRRSHGHGERWIGDGSGFQMRIEERRRLARAAPRSGIRPASRPF